MNKKNISIICLILTFSMFFSGCSKIHSLEVKMGFKNNDFQYIIGGKVNKILIQNKRDTGFKFVVTDKNTISEFYDILSSGKRVNEKSPLEADYIIELYEYPNKIHKFNYVVGIGKKNGGNFYDGNKIYSISKRIDDDVINNFFNIRKPKKFNVVYYETILKSLEKYENKYGKNKNIAINIKNDIEVSKFILSTDIESFKEKLNNNISMYKDEKDGKDVEMKVDTYGYRTYTSEGKVCSLYKAVITFVDNKNNKEKKYWIWNTYKGNGWNYNIYDKKPKNKIDGETF